MSIRVQCICLCVSSFCLLIHQITFPSSWKHFTGLRKRLHSNKHSRSQVHLLLLPMMRRNDEVYHCGISVVLHRTLLFFSALKEGAGHSSHSSLTATMDWSFFKALCEAVATFGHFLWTVSNYTAQKTLKIYMYAGAKILYQDHHTVCQLLHAEEHDVLRC